MIVVADTTPILTLVKINHLDVLQKLYGAVHIPIAVYKELTENHEFSEEAEIVQSCGYLEVHSDIAFDRVDLLMRATGLDLGESEAIILANQSETKTLLMDERHGRTVAKQMGIPVTGVIGVLMAAYTKGILTADEIRESAETMRLSNRFISDALYELLLSILEN